MSGEQFDDLITFKRFMPGIPENPEELEQIRELTETIRTRGDCVSLKTLALSGKDLIGLGMSPGPAMGETLNSLLELVLEYPEKNTRKQLIKELEKASGKST